MCRRCPYMVLLHASGGRKLPLSHKHDAESGIAQQNDHFLLIFGFAGRLNCQKMTKTELLVQRNRAFSWPKKRLAVTAIYLFCCV